MTDQQTNGSRTHEPSLRELTSDLDGLRELLLSKLDKTEAILDERDRLYDTRFKAAELAVGAALAAQEKLVSAAFLASEKAIVKAEDAQREYNIRSNEFRGQLDDQAKTLMPRAESMTMHRATADKIEVINVNIEHRVVALNDDTEKKFEAVIRDIVNLRESRSNMDGRMVIVGIAGASVVAVLVSLISAILLQVFTHATSAPASAQTPPPIIYNVPLAPAPVPPPAK